MEETKGFYDMCVVFNNDEEVLREMCTELVDLGYRTIAIEQIYDHSKKDSGKPTADIFPEPVNLKWLQDEFKNKLEIFQRLTIVYVDVAVSHAMNNSMNIRKFNLVAGQPKTDAALTHCCTTFNGDIVTFVSQDAERFNVNRKAYKMAVKRGIFFEIKYSPLIKNASCRMDIIKMASNYLNKGKSKSVIYSSGATDALELKGPYDIAYLSFIFGLTEDKGKCAIDRYCRQILLKAEARRIGKTGPIVFSDSSDSEDDDDTEDSEEGSYETEDEDEDYSENLETDESDSGGQPNKKKKINKTEDEANYSENSETDESDSGEQPNKKKTINKTEDEANYSENSETDESDSGEQPNKKKKLF